MSEMTTTLSDKSAPWYRYPWVWLVVCIPFTAVLFGMVMLYSAGIHRDDLVVDDYYKEGKGINRRLEQDEKAMELGVSASMVSMSSDGLVFVIEVQKASPVLNLYHVTSRELDLKVALEPAGNRRFVANSPELAARLGEPGIWYVEIHDPDAGWRIRARVVTPVNSLEFGADE